MQLSESHCYNYLLIARKKNSNHSSTISNTVMKKHLWKNPTKNPIQKKEQKRTENWGFWKHFFLRKNELQYPFNSVFFLSCGSFWMQWIGIVQKFSPPNQIYIQVISEENHWVMIGACIPKLI